LLLEVVNRNQFATEFYHFKEGNQIFVFRDNEVLLPNGNDVIVSPPSGGAARTFFMTDSERAT